MSWKDEPEPIPPGKQLRVELAIQLVDAVFYEADRATNFQEIATRACNMANALAEEIEARGWMDSEEES